MEYREYTEDQLADEILKNIEFIINRLYETLLDCIMITYDKIDDTSPMFIYPITHFGTDVPTFKITEINSKMLTRGEDREILDISKINIEKLQDILSKPINYLDYLDYISIEDNTILLLTSTPIAEMLEEYYIEKLTKKNQEMLEEYQTMVNARWN
ncbi:MAG: hypothetical protein KAI18_02085 [Candidatus Aenigmarchaeota archaeon]|nr:hypothetical protein [Candidatus Aenigmarchaeota archaeon]